MIDIDEIERSARALLAADPDDFETASREYHQAASAADVLMLTAELRSSLEDASLFRMLVSTCDALDANAFDASNQPGTLRIVCKHKTETYPELRTKIVDFIKGYKSRIDAGRAKEKA